MTQAAATSPSVEREARTFIVLAVAAGFTAWDIGFDLGAFENIDHRRVWAIWILSTVALAASLLFKTTEVSLPGRLRFVLAVPSLWLIADFFLVADDALIALVLTVLSLATLPVALYILFRLLAGDFFALTRRSQLALVGLTVAILLVGWYVGSGHERFLSCEDFARAGDFVPDNCSP